MEQEQFQRRLFQRLRQDTAARYKYPFPDRAVEYLRMCYLGEMKKRRITAGLDSATQEKIAKVAKWLTHDLKPSLLLYGTVGSGKTTMAGAVCTMIGITHDTGMMSTTKCVRRITAGDLAEMQTSDGEKFRSFKEASMLFIDDFGTEPRLVKNYGNELTPLIDVLYYRYDRQLFTILTTNLDDRMIAQYYGERIADRITEMFDKISYDTVSYRK